MTELTTNVTDLNIPPHGLEARIPPTDALLGIAIKAAMKLKSRDLPVCLPGEAPIRPPSDFRTLNLADLKSDEPLFEALVRTYQLSFGSERDLARDGLPIWGEGAYCEEEGPTVKVGLESYESGASVCVNCGADMLPFYPFEKVQQMIESEIGTGGGRCTVMMAPESTADNPVVAGFSWSAECGNRGDISERISMRYRKNGEPEKGQMVAGLVEARLRTLGVKSTLFFDELATLAEYRKLYRIDHVRFLIRPSFELAYQHGINKAIFWTSDRSPVKRMAMAMGFEPVLEVDGLVFLLNNNIKPLLALMQNQTEAEILGQVKSGGKIKRINGVK